MEGVILPTFGQKWAERLRSIPGWHKVRWWNQKSKPVTTWILVLLWLIWELKSSLPQLLTLAYSGKSWSIFCPVIPCDISRSLCRGVGSYGITCRMVFLPSPSYDTTLTSKMLSKFHSLCFLFPPSLMLHASFLQKEPMQKFATTRYLPPSLPPVNTVQAMVNEEMTIAKERFSAIIALENIKKCFFPQA